MKRLLIGFFCGIAFSAVYHSVDFHHQNRITGFYTDMEYHEQSGDVSGLEIFLVNSKRGYYIVFQSAEGSPSVPVVVPIKLDGHKVKFEIPDGEDRLSGVFEGEINDKGLVGQFLNGSQNLNGLRGEDNNFFHLINKKSFWQ